MTREPVEEADGGSMRHETSVVRSDDGASLVHGGNKREGVRTIGHQRDWLRIRPAGSQRDASENTVPSFTAHLVRSANASGGRTRVPGAGEIDRLEVDMAEVVTFRGWQIASGVPMSPIALA